MRACGCTPRSRLAPRATRAASTCWPRSPAGTAPIAGCGPRCSAVSGTAPVRSSTRSSSGPPKTPAVRAAVMQDLGRLFGASESAERCLALVSEIADPGGDASWQPAALSGIAAGLRARGMASDTQSALMMLVSADTPQGRIARERLATQMERASKLALLDAARSEQRLPAIELLGQGEWPVVGATLAAAARAPAGGRDPGGRRPRPRSAARPRRRAPTWWSRHGGRRIRRASETPCSQRSCPRIASCRYSSMRSHGATSARHRWARHAGDA